MSQNANAELIGSMAELLWGDCKQSQPGKAVLTFTLLRLVNIAAITRLDS